MSTPDEYGGHANPAETRLKREDTQGQIDSVLQHFDVLPSSVDRFIFKYISLYLIGLFVPGELFLLLFFLNISPQVQAHVGGVLLGGGLSALGVVVVLISLWLFHAWRGRTPKTLRDLFEQKHIVMPDGDVSASYLSFLENYRNALTSPKRHLLSGIPMICFSAIIVYATVNFSSVAYANRFLMILGVAGILLYALDVLGGLYAIGIMIWVMYISGWYVRKLVRTFELNIQPFHPDQCGGLKLLGNFCFGLVSPLLLFCGFSIGHLLLFLSARGLDIVFLASNVGFALFLLLYAIPVIVFAFLLPLWDIHIKMVSEGEAEENIYLARIQALRQEIQALLDTNQIEKVKAVQEKKALVETLYTPYPTWPFRVRSKIVSTLLGVGGSLLIGVIAAALQQ